MSASALVTIENEEMFKSLVEGQDDKSGIVIHFAAGWCDPCKGLNEFLEKQSAKYQGKLLFATVDVEQVPAEFLEAQSVETVPHVSFYRRLLGRSGHERVADIFGAKYDVLERNLDSLYGGGAEVPENHASIDDFLKYLINKAKIMIFITGTPSRPRCGFTGKLIELFNDLKVEYTYYDIMSNDAVCERLKTYSEWPTYPQIYVEGELIGGLDIVKELHSKDQLLKTLKMA